MGSTFIFAQNLLEKREKTNLTNLSFVQNQSDTLDSIQMKYELYKLKNGLQVLLQSDSSVDQVSVEFWLAVGIRDEPSNKYGLAHFFEHVTPYGLRGKTKEQELFKTYRTDSNAQVKKDFTRYYVKVKPEGLDLALQYTAERLTAKSIEIDNEKVESERVRVLAEIERNSKNPWWSAEGALTLPIAVEHLQPVFRANEGATRKRASNDVAHGGREGGPRAMLGVYLQELARRPDDDTTLGLSDG